MIGRNNPFNIRISSVNKWKGQIGSKRGFCVFLDRGFGIRAAAYLLLVSYRKRGIDTIDGIINRFAPPSENETYKYIMFVCSQTCIGRYVHLTTIVEYCEVLCAMSRFEGNIVVFGEVYAAISRFNLTMAPLKK